MVGEVFIYQGVEKTQVCLTGELINISENNFLFQSCLEDAKKKLEEEIKETTKRMADIKNSMSDLKSHLYGKFGNHINLEAEEE